jgi:Zn-dependent protease
MSFLEEIKRAVKVPLKMHWSFIILPLLFIWVMGFVPGLIACAILTVSILFHEYAHVWMAQRQFVRVAKVILLGFGAGAMLDPNDIIGQHKKELKIALAGPIASVILFVLFLVLFLLMMPFGILAASELVSSAMIFACVINLAVAIFNMLPLYPMDGGRVMNALLSMRMGGIKAVKISAIVTYIFSGLGVVLGLIFGQWWLAAVLAITIVFAKAQKDQVLKGLGGI